MSGVGSLPGFPQAPPDALSIDAGPGLDCRPAHEDDLAGLLALYASTREAEFAALGLPAATLQDLLLQQFRAQHLHYVDAYRGAHFMVIASRCEVVGRLYLHTAAAQPGADHRLVEISLLPRVQRQGLGSRLVRACQQGAAGAGRGLGLSVLQSNPGARRLYQRLGFLEQGSEGPYLSMRWAPGPLN